MYYLTLFNYISKKIAEKAGLTPGQEIHTQNLEGTEYLIQVRREKSRTNERQGVLKVGKTVAVEDHANALSGLHGRALVVRMIDLDALKSIYILLNDLCPGKGKMQYIGGLSVLITFEDNKVATMVRDAAREVLDLSEEQDFIPGNVFDFDADCHTDGVLDGNGPNINKRKKKGGLGSVGQINPAYSSSLEKSKVGKKHRLEEDVFGLDQLLGLDKDKEPFSSAHGDPQDLDLNSQPCIEPLPEHFSVDLDRSNRSEFSSIFQATEVEATIAMGERLGADLSKSHDMIQDSIVTEGLQGVKK
ncbi:hypothetical protein L1987_17877 [Smallanthus sonchifolius]|uniref:Uncharacterized protein n=1 Tax=Smallanthus sonchifolius TaxID=185202 RepID=A0ACB9J057_9ASTR|nr:hypothetical protein L1987_17877 [Smallanthus sonchifolius]